MRLSYIRFFEVDRGRFCGKSRRWSTRPGCEYTQRRFARDIATSQLRRDKRSRQKLIELGKYHCGKHLVESFAEPSPVGRLDLLSKTSRKMNAKLET